ncbi:MAG: aminoacetone oxidase family FAD-binding enzyme [Bacteroidales bacterium]|nr:aminoacetone oxidase family FAD-binding enzyme [Bacteroidales bacterium]
MGKVAIVGCGAAGAFCAANLSSMRPDLDITVFEAGKKPLAKVALTGGGRCNLTNSFEDIPSIRHVYPRGDRLMKRALKEFGPADTCKWFEDRGVRLVLQEDHRWFPASQDAMEIVVTLLKGLAGCRMHTSSRVRSVLPGLRLVLEDGREELFDNVVITTGGAREFRMLSPLSLEIVPPVPSLFTFETDSPIRALSGTSASVSLAIAGTPFRSSGNLLVTDWGFSGPAVLALSSYAARHLAGSGYRANLIVNWLGSSEEDIRHMLEETVYDNPSKQLASVHPVPSRLWKFLLDKFSVNPETRWGQLAPSTVNRLAARLSADEYRITGKGRFREEFVTCGGVALPEVNPGTMECRKHPGLYFAGEVLDIDAITGGFNLQAAWTTGFLAARAIGVL